jgi:tetratricopeptide (TPR) repeat protein
MIIIRIIVMFFMVYLFAPIELIQAGQCDDTYNKANGIYDAAKESMNQKNYLKAQGQFQDAARLYEQAASMTDCSCPKIPGNSRSNAESSKRIAINCRQAWESQNKYEANKKTYDDYNRAKDKFMLGNTQAKNREWDKAISSFEEAAFMWDRVYAASPQSDNGKRAYDSARQARNAASLARDNKKRK